MGTVTVFGPACFLPLQGAKAMFAHGNVVGQYIYKYMKAERRTISILSEQHLLCFFYEGAGSVYTLETTHLYDDIKTCITYITVTSGEGPQRKNTF